MCVEFETKYIELLSDIEFKIYMVILVYGKDLSSYFIEQKVGKSRTVIYRALKSLREKGVKYE